MKTTNHQVCEEKGLTDEQKCSWDSMIDNLVRYFNTPEGEVFYENFTAVMTRINENIKERKADLTKDQERALAYIKRKQKGGHMPTVREVTKHLGYRSSRTGYRILCQLNVKGLI